MKNRHLLAVLVVLCALNVIFGVWTMAREDANRSRGDVLDAELQEFRERNETRHGESEGQVRQLRSELVDVHNELTDMRRELARVRSDLDRYQRIPWLNVENSGPPWAKEIADLRSGLEGVYDWLAWVERFLIEPVPDPE